jgi:outer membrane protein OmpA-like peptidoglycan-associated protein
MAAASSALRHPWLVAALVGTAVALGGCSAAVTGNARPADATAVAGAAEEATGAGPTTETSSPDTAEALPAGAAPGLDDLNDDGVPEPTCGTHDYGAALVLRVLCDAAAFARPPTEDTVLVPDSLFALPNLELDLTGISGDAAQARDPDGRRIVVLFINSDTLFQTGAATLSDPARANLDAIGALIGREWPGAPVQVRGHTDATGTPAANQRLSEQRATTTADYLATRGIDRSRITSAGLGATVPIVAETDPGGGPDAEGQAYNRRVEIVITVP